MQNPAEENSATPLDLGNVLVTGGAGFVGANLARTLLERGCRVRVFDLAECSLEYPELEKIQGSICDPEAVRKACEGIDTVFHTAAVIEIRPSHVVSQEVRDLSYDVNLGGTQNVVEGCLSEGVSRLVYTSSNYAGSNALLPGIAFPHAGRSSLTAAEGQKEDLSDHF